jgi:hypothetical protein
VAIVPRPRSGPATRTAYTTGTFQRNEISALPIERGWAAGNAFDRPDIDLDKITTEINRLLA